MQRRKPGAAGRPRCEWSSALGRARARGREGLYLPGGHCPGFPATPSCSSVGPHRISPAKAGEWPLFRACCVWSPTARTPPTSLPSPPDPTPEEQRSVLPPASGWLAVGAGEYLSTAKRLSIVIAHHSYFTGNGTWNLGNRSWKMKLKSTYEVLSPCRTE